MSTDSTPAVSKIGMDTHPTTIPIRTSVPTLPKAGGNRCYLCARLSRPLDCCKCDILSCKFCDPIIKLLWKYLPVIEYWQVQCSDFQTRLARQGQDLTAQETCSNKLNAQIKELQDILEKRAQESTKHSKQNPVGQEVRKLHAHVAVNTITLQKQTHTHNPGHKDYTALSNENKFLHRQLHQRTTDALTHTKNYEIARQAWQQHSDTLTAQKESLQQKLDNLIQEALDHIEHDKRAQQAWENHTEGLTTRNATLQEEVEKLTAEVKQQTETYQTTERTWKKNYTSLAAQNTPLHAQLNDLTQSATSRAEPHDSELAGLTAEKISMEAQLTALTEENTSLQAQITALLTTLREQTSQSQTQIAALTAQIHTLHAQVNASTCTPSASAATATATATADQKKHAQEEDDYIEGLKRQAGEVEGEMKRMVGLLERRREVLSGLKEGDREGAVEFVVKMGRKKRAGGKR